MIPVTDHFLYVSGNTLTAFGRTYACAIGKGGITTDKHEGDGCTPVGSFALRECWYRMDRQEEPKTRLSINIIRPEDGWCDAPTHPSYNRHVRLPFDASHELMFRDDAIYDIVVPLGYNDDPVIPGKGSAIFLHVAHDDYRDTEGCIALARDDLLEVLAKCGTGTIMVIA